ncbi:CoA-binding protein [Candidatus Falkowbacteria bacterium]|nr:MAG: CoA-binding protein [Candidatus Falkowbacteria bacterium]
MLNKNNVYAVVGATKNKQKYGYKVLKNLKKSGYKMIPINLNEKEILSLKTYGNILDVDRKIDMVIFVVPSIVTEKILQDVKKLKINKVWMQPGSENDKAIQYCKNNNIQCIHNACVIVKDINNKNL